MFTIAFGIGLPVVLSTRPDRTSSGLSPGSSRFERIGAPRRKYGPSISVGVGFSSPGPGGSGWRTARPAMLPPGTRSPRAIAEKAPCISSVVAIVKWFLLGMDDAFVVVPNQPAFGEQPFGNAELRSQRAFFG